MIAPRVRADAPLSRWLRQREIRAGTDGQGLEDSRGALSYPTSTSTCTTGTDLRHSSAIWSLAQGADAVRLIIARDAKFDAFPLPRLHRS